MSTYTRPTDPVTSVSPQPSRHDAENSSVHPRDPAAQKALPGELSHACGYADGYMKLMLDAGFVSPKELVKVVDEARRGH